MVFAMQADADIGTLRPPTFDLKWSVMWHVAAIALLCFLGAATISIYEVTEEAWQANRSIGDAVGRHLELQLVPRQPIGDVQRQLGDATAVATGVMKPGQCVQYVNSADKNVVSHCLGFHNQGQEAPEWFSALYSHTLGGRMSYDRPIVHRGVAIGKIVVNSPRRP
jgi:hypothetical protein